MEDTRFVRELKEVATGKRLPTIEDLGPGYISPFEESMNPKEHPEIPLEPDVDDQEEEPTENKKEETDLEEDISSKVIKLHKEGKTLDELYSILKEQGYSYQSIENAILELVKEEKTKSRPEPEYEEKEDYLESDELPKNKINLEETPATEPKTEESFGILEKGDFAPLFIRVGKYRETMEALKNLENYLKGMDRLFRLARELDKIREDNLSTLEEMYQKTSETASRLYSGLLKPKGIKFEGGRESQAEVDKLNEVLSNLNNEIGALKEEIDKIRVLE